MWQSADPSLAQLFACIRQPTFEPSWPESWRLSYRHDANSVFSGDSSLGYRLAYRNRFRHAIRLLLETTAPGGRVLDVAAAQGNFTIVLAELGYSVVWNDLRSDLEGYVRMKTERADIEFVPGNVFDLPVGFDGTFDAVLATEIVEHVAHPDAFLRRLGEMLNPSGVIVITTPNGKYMRNGLPRFSDFTNPESFEAVQFRPDADGHIFLLHPEEWTPLAMSAGLAVRSLRLFNNPLTNGWLGARFALPLLPSGLVDVLEKVTGRLPRLLSERVNTHQAVLLSRAPQVDR